MKKLFTEPEAEILKFLCDDTLIGADSPSTGNENEGVDGGSGDLLP